MAARLGQLSDETKAILERFGFEAPIFVKNMRTQVQDLDFDTPPILNQAVTVDRAWSAMEDDRHVSAIPITNDDGKLVGMLTPGDVAEYNMRNITDPCGGSRTPVRKRFLGNFSGRRRSFTFPHPGVGRQTTGVSSFMIHGALKALRTHVHH